jgi:hypothetical protein
MVRVFATLPVEVIEEKRAPTPAEEARVMAAFEAYLEQTWKPVVQDLVIKVRSPGSSSDPGTCPPGTAWTGAGCRSGGNPAWLSRAQAMVDKARNVYPELPATRILVDDPNIAGAVATSRPGVFTIRSVTADSHRDTLLAQLIANVLVPRAPSLQRTTSQAELNTEEAERILRVNVKAVEVLQRVWDFTERGALIAVSARLESQHAALQTGHTVPLANHYRPCQELAYLWAQFPAYPPPDSLPKCPPR